MVSTSQWVGRVYVELSLEFCFIASGRVGAFPGLEQPSTVFSALNNNTSPNCCSQSYKFYLIHISLTVSRFGIIQTSKISRKFWGGICVDGPGLILSIMDKKDFHHLINESTF